MISTLVWLPNKQKILQGCSKLLISTSKRSCFPGGMFLLPFFLGWFCVGISPSKLILTSEVLCDVDAGCVYPMSFDQGFTDIKNMSFKNKKHVVYLISGEAFLLTKNSYLCFAIDTCTWNHTLGRGYTEDGRPPLKMHADEGDRET